MAYKLKAIPSGIGARTQVDQSGGLGIFFLVGEEGGEGSDLAASPSSGRCSGVRVSIGTDGWGRVRGDDGGRDEQIPIPVVAGHRDKGGVCKGNVLNLGSL
jgi:hypothetical protein